MAYKEVVKSIERTAFHIQHKSNPLHIYCRMRDCGFSKEDSIFVGKVLEHTTYPVINTAAKCVIWACMRLGPNEKIPSFYAPSKYKLEQEITIPSEMVPALPLEYRDSINERHNQPSATY